jgi:hypothetical protein
MDRVQGSQCGIKLFASTVGVTVDANRPAGLSGRNSKISRFRANRVTEAETFRGPALLNSLAISGIQASGDQRARRLDPVKITVATELRAPCLLAPRHPAVNIGCGVYARVGGRASRQQCADDYCRKLSAFRFHHGYLPYQNVIGKTAASIREAQPHETLVIIQIFVTYPPFP